MGALYNMLGPGPVHDPAGADGEPRRLGAGPLAFEMIEPFGLWKMRIDGHVHSTSVDCANGGTVPRRGRAGAH